MSKTLRSSRRMLWLLVALAAVAPVLLAQSRADNDKAAADARRNRTLPLQTTRTLSFATTEASWLSLDLSPDGRTLVFEILGDLYTLPVAGGTATRITNGQAYDMQPKFSPDGTKIVFVSDRDGAENLWVAKADGTDPKALTTTERESYMSPIWTPDGEYVIAARGAQLWLYHRDGGSGLQMTGQSAAPAGRGAAPPAGGGASPALMGPAFSPDPRFIWVNMRGSLGGGFASAAREPWQEPWEVEFGPDHQPRSSAREIGPFQIGQLDRETGRLHVRTHEHFGALRPTPSPDGRWLVYATRYDARQALKALDLTTGEDHWLVMDVQRDDSQGGGGRDRDVYPASAFTPDSQALITSYGGKIWRVEVPSGTATEIPFTATVDQQLGPLVKFDYPINDTTLTVSQIRGARPSPDGRQLVFTALDRLWIADLPQGRGGERPTTPPASYPTISNARRLTTVTGVEHAPVWSPDGQYLAYVTWNDAEGGHIYRVRASGGQPERLTPVAAFFDKVTYTRDGSRIVAVRGSKMHRMRMLEDFGGHSGAAELEYVWMPATGGAPTRITWVGSGSTQQGRNAPHIGPDPDRVYVWAGSEGLLSMRFDGTDVKTVVRVTAPSTGGQGRPPSPDEVILSPDGKRALVRANRNVYMMTVPPVGGEAPTISVAASSSVPTWRLTRIGGDFIGWTHAGDAVFYSIGRSFFLHDPAIAKTIADRAAAAAPAGRGGRGAAGGDAAAATPPAGEGRGDAQAPEADRRPAIEYEAHRVDVTIEVPKDKPEGIIALRRARLITMNGDEVIPSGDIVITNNRITAVGPSGRVQIPAGADVRDMRGTTIMPGLVDIHAHTWVAWGVHREQVSQFLAQLAYGVTTQRDPQTSSEDVLSYGDLMEVGQLIGPRIYSTGPGVFAADNIRSLDDARDVLRRYADHYGTQTIKQYMAGDRKVRQWVIMAAHELGLTPTTEGGSNFTMNLTLMQDGYAGLEHSLPISPFYNDVVQLGAFSGLVYTPTFIVSYGGPSGRQFYLTTTNVDADERLRTFTPHDELDKWKSTSFNRADQYVFPLHAEQLRKWVEAGGRAGLGSHGEVQGLGTHWELWMMASGGMKAHDALRVATLDSADAIGMAKDIGSLEAGKLADLIVLDANPLDDLKHTTAIRYVMKNGRLYEGATLNEVWPRQRALPEQWWWRVEPPPLPPAQNGGGR
ncbi:MAG TPA: amidohydrolase family protein [Vicinamibacterales bacterium]|nr:amidohydrolase family protein [Vicinamibacterales bacterium]